MNSDATNNDRPDWEVLKRGCDTIEGLSTLEKQKARVAFESLEDFFGPGFLDVAYAEGHPIRERLFNRAPWTRQWLIHFAMMLKQLPSWRNHESLSKRLRSRTGFDEALSVLQTAHKFSTAGFSVLIEPSVTIKGKPKKPDLQVRSGDGEMESFVGVSEYTRANLRWKHAAQAKLFSPCFYPPRVLCTTSYDYTEAWRQGIWMRFWTKCGISYRSPKAPEVFINARSQV